MFGLGMPEILLILAIALMVIGPKKLPDLAKTLGRAMGEFKKAAQDFKHSIDMENTVREFEKPVKSVKDDLKEAVGSAEKTSEKPGADTGDDPSSPSPVETQKSDIPEDKLNAKSETISEGLKKDGA